jgi:hypothetical protein
MATAYDTWKTTEPYDAEGEFVAERRDALAREWMKDLRRVSAAFSEALADDTDGRISDEVARFFIAITGKHGEPTVSQDAFFLRGWIDHDIRNRITADAERQAQSEWHSRQTGPEE